MIILIRNHTGPVYVIWAKKWSLHKIETKIAYLAKVINIFWSIDRGCNPRKFNRLILNELDMPSCTVHIAIFTQRWQAVKLKLT